MSFENLDGTTELAGLYRQNKKPDPNFFGGLGPMNTVADFISELNDSYFRDILGDETMDRALGSFEQEDLFRLMARIFLNTGFEKWAMKS